MALILYMTYVSPPCRAVLMTLKHIGVETEIREEHFIYSGNYHSSEILKINPRGCVPTIDDSGFHLWESRAIMTYLINKFAPCSPLYPREPEKRAVVDMMLCFDQGTLYKTQVEYLYPLVYYGEEPDWKTEVNYKNSLRVLENALSVNPFVAGDQITLADLSIVANIALADTYDFSFRPYYNIRNWLQKMKKLLPYYREVNEVPLLQFKFYNNYNFGFVSDEACNDSTRL